MAQPGKVALGLDFGTNSVRALLVDVATGEEIATAVWRYERGDDGILTDEKNPNVARQHPEDYVRGAEAVTRAALSAAALRDGFEPQAVIGIGVDTTGSTPMPVDETCRPLAFRDEFAENLNAMAWLWKDHSGVAEAEEITDRAAREHPEYLAKCGGTYSSEWFFSKLLHCLRVDPKVFEAAATWLECADYVPALLTGVRRPPEVLRSVCAAGHKAMFHADRGLPSAEFLGKLDPRLGAVRARLFETAYTADNEAGRLCDDWAARLGLPAGIPVAVGAFDAHLGAVGAGIRPGRQVKVIGTSSCDMLVEPNTTDLPDIPGLCGIVDGSILPGHHGLEAGQSAVGDIFNWFVKHIAGGEEGDVHGRLTERAAALRPGESGLLALDWNNGNRTVLVDARLTGLLLGQTLHTTHEEMYRALIEATAFGGRKIIERFTEYGVRVDEVVNTGGIAEKNPLVMQIYADVIGRPMRLSRSAQTCALGAAMFGAVVAGPERGGHPGIGSAQEAMSGLKDLAYTPDAEAARCYDELYAVYSGLHDAFGVRQWRGSLYDVMKTLIGIRDRARG